MPLPCGEDPRWGAADAALAMLGGTVTGAVPAGVGAAGAGAVGAAEPDGLALAGAAEGARCPGSD